MRTLILPLALIVACGGAMARPPNDTDLRSLPETIWHETDAAFKSVNPNNTLCKDGPFTCNVGIGIDVMTNPLFNGKRDLFLGAKSGLHVTDGSDDVLVGTCTNTPTPHTSGFVNIANRLCFWRDSGERVACPPLESGCSGK